MRWFKHFSDNHRGQTVQTLMNEYGHSGPAAYYFIMEMCAEKVETKSECSDFVFTFKRPYFDNILRMKRKSTDNILRTLSEAGVLKSEANENEVRIEMPILLNLLDRDLKKPRLVRASNAQNPRLDIEIDKDKDKDKELDKIKIKNKITKIPAEPTKGKAFVALYCDHFKKRWGEYPHILKKDAGIIKRLSETLTLDDYKTYLDAYFSMPDAWIVKAKHPVGIFELKLNEIVIYSKTGSFTTNRQVQQADDYASNMVLLNKIRNGSV